MDKTTIKYKGYEIHVKKMTGYVATIWDEKGDVVNDEPTLLDTKTDSIEDAKEFIDAITKQPQTLK